MLDICCVLMKITLLWEMKPFGLMYKYQCVDVLNVDSILPSCVVSYSRKKQYL
jgi:hypothetical protein